MGPAEASPWWWWREKWRLPSLFSTDPVSQITRLEPASLCLGHRQGGLPRPANSCAPVLGWDSNSFSVCPGTGEVPLFATCYVVPLVLSCPAAFQGKDHFLLLWTAPLTYHQTGGWLSSSSGARMGQLAPVGRKPFSQRWDPSQSQLRFISCSDTVVCFPTHLFSSFVSTQKGIPPLMPM